MSSIRVLAVDDYEPFRRFVCSKLATRSDLQIVGELADGLEAVRKSEELRPDLIVLDLGLPSLNGIEAARRIRVLSPESKILFVSQETSTDVVDEALRVGALGYVAKTQAESELLAAVEAVLQGEQYLSGGLLGRDCSDTMEESLTKAGSPMAVSEKVQISRRHAVEFFSDDASFLRGFTRFIEAALLAGNAVIVVVTESHQKSLLQGLQERGVNVAAAIEEGRYRHLDVAETLSTFMVNDSIDPIRFLEVAGNLVASTIRAAKGQPPRVAACGECAPVLWAQGKPDAAIQLEHLWDEIAKTHDVEILCGYVLTKSQREQESQIRGRICAEIQPFGSATFRKQ